MIEKKEYHPEDYWSEVGQKIQQRSDANNVIAGDDEPYYRYKREQFLALLREVDFKGKRVLEIGHGPGGNLIEVHKLKPGKLVGVDISQQMVDLATKNVPSGIELVKINGTQLPFPDKSFDIVFSATVLQHNTDEKMLAAIIAEMSRVSASNVYLFERIEKEITGDDLCLGRPVAYYESFMKKAGFTLLSKKFINVRVSYYVAGMVRKGLNPGTRKEGEPLNKLSNIIQLVSLPITKLLDKVFTSPKDVARLEFKRES